MSSRWIDRLKAALDKPENRVLLIISLIGLVVRLPGIGYSFYGDEHFSVLRDSIYFYTPSEDRFRPVFFSLLYLWRRLGFSGEVGLRLLPLIFGVAQIPVAHHVGRRLGGERMARVFSILVAASPMLIEFSQELRMYSMVALLALLQALTYLRLIERPGLGRWSMFVLIALLGVYTHLHYWLFLAGFALLFLIEHRRLPLWKGWGALATALVLYLPNIPNIQRFAQVRGGDYIVHLPSALPKLLAGFTLGFNYFQFENEVAGRPVGLADVLHNFPVMLLAVIPATVILWWLIRIHFRKSEARRVILCHALFTVPVLLAFAASAVTKQYWLQPKYVIFSAPFALLFIAAAYQALSPAVLRRTTAALGTAVLAVALLHSWDPQHYGRREDWRGAAENLRARMTLRSVLVLAPGGYGLLRYYWPEAQQKWQMVDPDSARPILQSRLYSSGYDYAAMECFYLWSDIRRNGSDPQDEILKSFMVETWRVDSIQFNPRFKLYHGMSFWLRRNLSAQ